MGLTALLALTARFSPDWFAFAAELQPVLAAHAGSPAARDTVRRAIWDGHSERGYHVTRQARDLGYEVADSNHKIVRWRLLVPAVARVTGLPDWATLGLAHLGCLALVAVLAILGRRLAPGASLPAVFGFCLTAGATAPFFTSMGWLGYYDSLLALGLLAVAFAPGRALVLAGCLLTPWVDERFILGLPLALLVRLLCSPEASLRAWLRREALAPLALAGVYALLRLTLGGSGGSQTVSQYLGQFVFGYPLDGLQRLAGAWAGLRLGWILALLALAACFLPAAGLRPRLGPALAATALLPALVALHTALDLSRSTVLLLPLLPLGWRAAARLLPPPRLTQLSLALATLALALPAHHVFGKASLPVESAWKPSLPLKNAFHRLGLMHARGELGRRDPATAIHWYRQAAELGYAPAQNNLGVLLAAGDGAPRDEAAAAHWYQLAAAQGESSALTNLARCLEQGAGVPRDPAAAVALYLQATALGDDSARTNLGAMYARGDGVPRDPAEAARLYRLAAERGHAAAQANLAILYATGEGVLQDPAAAFAWMNRAAAQGDTLARKNLAVLHERGIGTPPDAGEALRWFQRAAAGGNAEAQATLGAKYAHGQGLPRDLLRALAWTALAAANGDPQAAANLPRLAPLASPQERATAAALANRWRQEGPPDESAP